VNESRHALLLVGSAKRPHSTSEVLGTHVLERLRTRGFSTETLFLHRAYDEADRCNALLDAVDRADIVWLASPLYVDSLPYLVIKTMERIAEHGAARPSPRPRRFAGIVNCGFPEARHAELAIRMCGLFAKSVRWEWTGGLALGGGEAIAAQPLAAKGGMVRNVVRALDMAADALADGRHVPPEALALMAKPMMPAWLYMLAGNWGWKRRAKQYDAQHRLAERPHACG
jgi:hypothetical protein